jgi:DNA-binding transcriptional LysR family regulator
MLSLSGLKAIDALASHGSISAAAAALGYTASAVSQQITRLEVDVHHPLVERLGRRATLTPAGLLLADAAGRILIELESVSAELQARSKTVTGRLTIAAFPTAARGIVPQTMEQMVRTWPDLEIRLTEVDSHRAVHLVAKGSVDLAVAHDWQGMPLELPDGLKTVHLGDDISDVLVHQDSPWAETSPVDLAALAGETWLYEPGSVAHDYLRRAFEGADSHPFANGHVIREYATQIEMVAVGIGIALVPRMGRGPLPMSVRVLPVRSAPVRRVYGVYRNSVGRRPAITAALGILRETCARSF